TAATAIALATGAWLLPGGSPPSPPHVTGRLLARATSEGGHIQRFPLPNIPEWLAVSPSGDRLFAASAASRKLVVIDLDTGAQRAVVLPADAGSLAMGADGKLYVGSPQGAVMIVDALERPERLISTAPAGGPVWNIALSPAQD